jgi:hypothetical protein
MSKNDERPEPNRANVPDSAVEAFLDHLARLIGRDHARRVADE